MGIGKLAFYKWAVDQKFGVSLLYFFAGYITILSYIGIMISQYLKENPMNQSVQWNVIQVLNVAQTSLFFSGLGNRRVVNGCESG